MYNLPSFISEFVVYKHYVISFLPIEDKKGKKGKKKDKKKKDKKKDKKEKIEDDEEDEKVTEDVRVDCFLFVY